MIPRAALVLLAPLALAGPLVAPAPAQDIDPQQGLFRFPDISATHIVFAFADDLWVVSRDGGTALPLASPPGAESLPRFSPDGKRIAFVGNYDGDRDLYTVAQDGGVPARVTHHPANELLSDWTPDGRLLFASNGLASLQRVQELFTVGPDGGLPARVPVPAGALGAVSGDGQWLAYTPHTTDFRTWKRYMGGLATDIWLFHLVKRTAQRVTDWSGTDTAPMWQGTTLYYLSDAGPAHRLNLWAYDSTTGDRRQVTHFRDFDVKFPSVGPGPDGKGEIVFQMGAGLRVLDCATGQIRAVDIRVPGARATLRPHAVDAAKFVTGWDLSPSGKRAVVTARGDVWSLPAEHGTPRNLTRTSGVAERHATWSPDGKWIACQSDASGEYQLTLLAADGAGDPRRLTRDGSAYRYEATWSPDSARLVFHDKTNAIWLHTIDVEGEKGGTTVLVDTDPWGTDGSWNGSAWSHDSQWLAYAKNDERSRNSAIWLYHVPDGATTRVTAGMFNDAAPVFDRAGDWLYFRSSRHFRPSYGDLETAFVYAGTEVLVAVPLRADQKSPFAPKSDEETGAKAAKDGADDAKKGDAKPDGAKADDAKPDAKAKKPVRVDLDGFEARAIQLPVTAGRFGRLAVNHKGQLLYVRRPVRGEPGGTATIHLYDLTADEPKEQEIAKGGDFVLSADGKQMLVPKGSSATIQPAGSGTGKPVPTASMTAWIDPTAEWRQLFTDAWRIQRDFFYDAGMHGVDWPGVRAAYQRLLPHCRTRNDVGYLIAEMISELNVGHAYYSGGDVGEEPTMTVGLLGCDFALEQGAYRIARLYTGAVWDLDARGPLAQPGLDVREGDWLLAVNGVPVDVAKDPWAAFLGLAERPITLTVSVKPTLDDAARRVVVRAAGSEAEVRYRAWIERNRALVAERTGGRVGYVYVPDTGQNGQNDLVRQYFAQLHLPALIIDERWNGGGQIPTRFIELLNRPIVNYWARRDGRTWPWPYDGHQGPKCMLINGHAGSGGDAFPAYFRKAGLGKLIGTRTWGGLVGISGNPRLIDGANMTVPTFGYYKPDGTWGIEGHGVDPDIEVLDDPSKMTDGGDPQLDAAIAHILGELERRPYVPTPKPAGPDRSGMGVPEKDR